MEEDFIYWRHPTVPGIKVEEVSGGARYQGEVWMEMARQLYCENGKDQYREIGHFHNGAPFLFGETSRISVSHCKGLYAVATLPPTPEVDLSHFSERAALGIDVERADRRQVLGIRKKFLTPEEMEMVLEDDVLLNILAWTMKESAYKAAFMEEGSLLENVRILSLPKLAPAVPVFDAKEFGLPEGSRELTSGFYGHVNVKVGEETRSFVTYSYLSDEFLCTLCYSPKCAKFGSAG